jgi:hypothetical protein
MLLLIILNIFQFSLIRHGSRLDRRDFTMNPTEEEHLRDEHYTHLLSYTNK